MKAQAIGDLELVERMLAGDEEAFDWFFEGHFSRLYRFALYRLDGDEDAAEEVAQMALSKAVRSLKSFRGEAALFTWLGAICRREIGARLKRRGRGPEQVALVEDSPEICAALDHLARTYGQDPEGQLRRGEMARLVRVTLDALPCAYGDALDWKYLQGQSVKEIAARLDLGAKAAESLLTRARQAFRDGFAAVTRERWNRDREEA